MADAMPFKGLFGKVDYMKFKRFLFLLCSISTSSVAGEVFLDRHPYPPLPSMLVDSATIDGVDVDGNGMRDLLDREIIEIVDLSCKDEKEKEFAYTKLFNIFDIMKPTNKIINLWVAKDLWLNLPCGIGAGGYESFFIAFEPTVDTDKRLDLAVSHALKEKL